MLTSALDGVGVNFSQVTTFQLLWWEIFSVSKSASAVVADNANGRITV
jgi:hypothetical protein